MAIYRTVSLKFWTDAKIIDNFSPEDKYFYLYLLTNPHTNLCGCYEITLKQMAIELGYSLDAVSILLERFENKYNLIKFSKETNELLILNWHKYNWTSSPKFRKPLKWEIENIKNEKFKRYLADVENGAENIRYRYGIYTVAIHLYLHLLLIPILLILIILIIYIIIIIIIYIVIIKI